MDLLFGTSVREHGYRIGRLAGLDVDRKTRVVHNIIISADGTIGPDIERRPLVAVPADHFGGDIVLRSLPGVSQKLGPQEMLTLSPSTRVVRGGRQGGRLSGVELSPATGEIAAIFGRQHWWMPRFHLDPSAVDFSVPGELRVGAATSRAA